MPIDNILQGLSAFPLVLMRNQGNNKSIVNGWMCAKIDPEYNTGTNLIKWCLSDG
jgi:hypothetical protein